MRPDDVFAVRRGKILHADRLGDLAVERDGLFWTDRMGDLASARNGAMTSPGRIGLLEAAAAAKPGRSQWRGELRRRSMPPHAPLRPYKSASGKDRVARLGRINRPATTWRKR